MFYPQAMTEIELIVPSKDLLAVTKIISGQGVFHQGESGYQSPEAEARGDNTWQERASSYAALERRIQTLLQTLNIDEGEPPTASSEAMVDLQEARSTVERIEQDVKQTSDQLNSERKKLEQLEGYLRQLEPVSDIDLDMGALHHSRYLFSMLGTMPTANVDRLQTSLSRVPYHFQTLRQDSQKSVVWLAGLQKNSDILDRAARAAYLNPLVLPEAYVGTPAEIILALQENLNATRERISELEASLTRMGKECKGELQALLWEVHASRMLSDAIVRFGKLRYTYVIVGWVPTARLEGLLQRIRQVSKDALIETFPMRRSAGNPDVPVALHHPKFLQPFEMLVTTYSRPRYGEVDPTWLIAVMFPLLFGAMFGDVGQGLTLALLGWLLNSRRVKALRSLASLGGLISICGLSATVFGFLYGSVFGFEDILPALWIRPIQNIMLILMIAIGGGIVLLSLAFIISIFNAWVARDWGRLLFANNGLAGLLLYWSLLGLVGGIFIHNLPVPSLVFLVIAALSAAGIMFSEPLQHLIEGYRPVVVEGIGTYAIQAFFELFETVISLFSNSLSYVRVGAFAVAHAGLSAAIFILANLLGGGGHGFGYWLVVVLGNVFIVGFEGLIVGIQTMRLSYYEFFSKFFTGGGLRYEPIRLRPSEEA